MPDPMKVFASCVRGMLVPAPGKKLLALDFAGIESRVTAWLAGETWKLNAFRAYDADTGPDTYKLAYARSFQVPIESVTDVQRQVGKVQELALGYQGGVGAFVTMTKTYGIKLDELTEAAWDIIPAEVKDASERYLDKSGKNQGLSRRTFIVCDSLKRLWRQAHPKIVALWEDMEKAAIYATSNPGKVYWIPNKKIGFMVKGKWLYMRLPSNRRIAYYEPEIEYDTKNCPDCEWVECPNPKCATAFTCDTCACRGKVPKDPTRVCPTCKGRHVIEDENTARLTYMGIDTYTRQWTRVTTYGGRIVQNAGEGVPRDLLCHGMLGMEEAGYETIMTVHDEGVFEVDEAFGSLEEARRIICDTPAWAEGLPVAAAGWEGKRYRK